MSRALPTSDRVSDNDIPDPNPLPYLFGNNVLVRPFKVVRKTKGGIVLPDSTQDDAEKTIMVGRVLAIGPGAWGEDDPWYKVGDHILFGRLAGRSVLFKSVKLIYFPAKTAIARLDDPWDIDSNFSITNTNY